MNAKQLEKKVKELSKKSSNKYCFDCGKKGIQNSVNLTVNTFVCSNCAGLLRSVNHQCKGISFHTFTKQQYEGLAAGGNRQAKKSWHAGLGEDYKVPETDLKMQEWMRQVYVEKRYWKEPGPDSSRGVKKSGPDSSRGVKSAPAPAKGGQSGVEPEEDVGEEGEEEEEEEEERPAPSHGGSGQSGGHPPAAASGQSGAGTRRRSADGVDLLSDFSLEEVPTTSPTPASSAVKPESKQSAKSAPDIWGDEPAQPSSQPKLQPASMAPASKSAMDGQGNAVALITTALRDIQARLHLSVDQLILATQQATQNIRQGGGAVAAAGGASAGKPARNPFDDDDDDASSGSSGAGMFAAPQPRPAGAAASKPAVSSGGDLFGDMMPQGDPRVSLQQEQQRGYGYGRGSAAGAGQMGASGRGAPPHTLAAGGMPLPGMVPVMGAGRAAVPGYGFGMQQGVMPQGVPMQQYPYPQQAPQAYPQAYPQAQPQAYPQAYPQGYPQAQVQAQAQAQAGQQKKPDLLFGGLDPFAS